MVSEKWMPSQSYLDAPFDSRHKMLPCITIHINQGGIACIILPLPTRVSRLHVPSQLCDKPGLTPLGADFNPLCLHSSSAAFASVFQEEYLSQEHRHNTILTIALQTFLCRSAFHRDTSHCAAATVYADTGNYCSYRSQNQGCPAAVWIKHTDWLTFSWVSCLQVSSPPGEGRAVVWLSLVFFVPWLSPCMACKHQKGAFV